MTDPRLEQFAKILVHYSLAVQPGEWVKLGGSVHALPLITEVAREILRAGGYYDLGLESEAVDEVFLAEANHAQLERVSPAERLLIGHMDALVFVNATGNTRALTGANPEKQRLAQKAKSVLHQIRLQRGVRWVYTEYPCAAYAQDADMSLRAYEDFVFAATCADRPDGVQACRDAYAEDDRRAALFTGHRTLSVRGPNVDLSLSIAGRTFVSSAGRHNAPDGEIYTGPVEDSVNGWIRFAYPAIYSGREVDGVEMRFEAGRVVQASAAKNNAYLQAILDTDAGARYLGEFAIGTNYQIQRFTRRILYDEKIAGTIHLALGNGYPDTGSRNTSGIHWDFICDMRQDSEIRADGEVIYRNGQFVS
jgi:aminopeptidase